MLRGCWCSALYSSWSTLLWPCQVRAHTQCCLLAAAGSLGGESKPHSTPAPLAAGGLLNAPVIIAAPLVAKRKAQAAVAKSSVKLEGRDVLATWKARCGKIGKSVAVGFDF